MSTGKNNQAYIGRVDSPRKPVTVTVGFHKNTTILEKSTCNPSIIIHCCWQEARPNLDPTYWFPYPKCTGRTRDTHGDSYEHIGDVVFLSLFGNIFFMTLLQWQHHLLP